MNYDTPFTYTPNQTQIEALGRTEPLTAFMDTYTGNAVVTSDPSNGVHAGDMLACRRNPNWDPLIQDGTPKYQYAITDVHNAGQAVRLARISISDAAERNEEQYDAVSSVLPVLKTPGLLTPAERKLIRGKLEGPLERLTSARNHDNKQAALELESALAVLQHRGRRVSVVVRDRLLGAVESLETRSTDLEKQLKNNAQRERDLERFQKADTELATRILGVVAAGGIQKNQERFVELARGRLVKPGNLTEQNAYFRAIQGDEDADRIRLMAPIFESLYGVVMRPLSQLSKLAIREAQANPDVATASLIVSLADLEDVVDVLATPGGDYIDLSQNLQVKVMEAQQNVLDEDYTEAKKTGTASKLLLRYRTNDLEAAPKAWYTQLPPKKRKVDTMSDEDIFRLSRPANLR